MRKLSLPVTIALIFSMLFAVGLPTVSAQDSLCFPYTQYLALDPASDFITGPVFAALGENQHVTISSPSFGNVPVIIHRHDINTFDLISETPATLPVQFGTANELFYIVELFTQDGTDIDWLVEVTCGEELLSCPIDDGRLDTSDCGALVAAYPNGTGLDIYGIDPASGEGVLVFTVDLSATGDVSENTLIGEGTNPFNGQPIRVYKLAGGGYQINSTQPNGQPYEFAWS